MDIKILLGDCFDFDLPCDCIVTEPLYAENGIVEKILETWHPERYFIFQKLDGEVEIKGVNIKDHAFSTGKRKRFTWSARRRTPRHVGLMVEILEDVSFPEDLILDPFMGSGSTGEACAILGRRFIGVERLKYVFENASARLHKYGVQDLSSVSEEVRQKELQSLKRRSVGDRV